MKIAVLILILLGIIAIIFAQWGLNTVAGRRAFDEMAGIVPGLSGVLGVILLIAAALLWFFKLR